MQLEAPIRIAALEEGSEAADVVAGWLRAEWPGAQGAAPWRWIARRGAQVVGVVGLAEEDDPLAPGSLPCLVELYVAPPWRGHGVGQALCRHVREEAGARGLPWLWLFTRDRQGYFQAQGWEESAQLERRTSRGQEWITLMRSPKAG